MSNRDEGNVIKDRDIFPFNGVLPKQRRDGGVREQTRIPTETRCVLYLGT